MSFSTRQEQVLQLINEIQAILDDSFIKMDNQKSLVHITNNYGLIALLKVAKKSVKVVNKMLSNSND